MDTPAPGQPGDDSLLEVDALLQEAEEAQRRLEEAEEQHLKGLLTDLETKIAQHKKASENITNLSAALESTEERLRLIGERGGQVAPELQDACQAVRDRLQQVVDLERRLDSDIKTSEADPKVVGRLSEDAIGEDAKRERVKEISSKAIALKKSVDDYRNELRRLNEELNAIPENDKTETIQIKHDNY